MNYSPTNLAGPGVTLPPPSSGNHSFIYRRIASLLEALCQYHQHEMIGIDNIPRQGGVLVAVNHGLATYDAIMIAHPIMTQLDRNVRGLTDRLVMRTPGLSLVAAQCGFVSGNREDATALLRSGELVGLAPGGMREALRSSRQRYQIDWRGRLGFVWLSMQSGVPIVLAACPRADDIYTVYESSITKLAYSRFRVPLPLARGLGPTLVPRPIKLWHLCSEAIYPDVPPDRVTKEDVEAHHARLVARMERLMQESLDLYGPSDI